MVKPWFYIYFLQINAEKSMVKSLKYFYIAMFILVQYEQYICIIKMVLDIKSEM